MTLTHRLLAPGWYRAFLGLCGGFLVGMGIVVGVRAAYGWDPLFDWDAIVTVGGLIVAPLGYLVGIGCFDYWFRWASGAPTIPEDHSGHGAYSWRDYFRVNTDHKVIGIQYICTTFVFFIAGGLMAMLMRAELATPGSQFVDPNTFNGLFSVHASLMIFLFIIPVFAGIANYVIPLMIGAPDMAFPRLNALSFWMLPAAGVMMICSYFAEGERSPPAGRPTPPCRPRPRWGSSSSRWASSSRAPRRSPPRSTSWSRSSPCGRRA